MADRAEASAAVEWERGLHARAGERVDPAAYFRYIGRWSALFVPAVLAAADASPGDRLLDVATGPGEAAVAAIPIVGAQGRVVISDVSIGMLMAARARLPAAACSAVTADGQLLPFRDGSFDAVVCQLGLMFFPDPGQGLREFRRVLRDRRRAAVCVISTAERAPLWGALATALSEVLPAQREVLQLSFRLAGTEHLAALFAAAGFSDVTVHRETREVTLSSFDDYWSVIESGAGQLPIAYASLPAETRRAVREAVLTRLAPFRSGTGLMLPIEMLIGAGRA